MASSVPLDSYSAAVWFSLRLRSCAPNPVFQARLRLQRCHLVESPHNLHKAMMAVALVQVRLGIAVVTYHSAATLDLCLRSIVEHCAEAVVVVAENSGQCAELGNVAAKYPDLDATIADSGGNVGFARGVNLAAGILDERGCTHLLVLNPDVELLTDPTALIRFLDEVDVVGGVLVGDATETGAEIEGSLRPSTRSEPSHSDLHWCRRWWEPASTRSDPSRSTRFCACHRSMVRTCSRRWTTSAPGRLMSASSSTTRMWSTATARGMREAWRCSARSSVATPPEQATAARWRGLSGESGQPGTLPAWQIPEHPADRRVAGLLR